MSKEQVTYRINGSLMSMIISQLNGMDQEDENIGGLFFGTKYQFKKKKLDDQNSTHINHQILEIENVRFLDRPFLFEEIISMEDQNQHEEATKLVRELIPSPHSTTIIGWFTLRKEAFLGLSQKDLKISYALQRLSMYDRTKNKNSPTKYYDTDAYNKQTLVGVFTQKIFRNVESEAELKAKNYDVKHVTGVMYKFFSFNDELRPTSIKVEITNLELTSHYDETVLLKEIPMQYNSDEIFNNAHSCVTTQIDMISTHIENEAKTLRPLEFELQKEIERNARLKDEIVDLLEHYRNAKSEFEINNRNYGNFLDKINFDESPRKSDILDNEIMNNPAFNKVSKSFAEMKKLNQNQEQDKVFEIEKENEEEEKARIKEADEEFKRLEDNLLKTYEIEKTENNQPQSSPEVEFKSHKKSEDSERDHNVEKDSINSKIEDSDSNIVFNQSDEESNNSVMEERRSHDGPTLTEHLHESRIHKKSDFEFIDATPEQFNLQKRNSSIPKKTNSANSLVEEKNFQNAKETQKMEEQKKKKNNSKENKEKIKKQQEEVEIKKIKIKEENRKKAKEDEQRLEEENNRKRLEEEKERERQIEKDKEKKVRRKERRRKRKEEEEEEIKGKNRQKLNKEKKKKGKKESERAILLEEEVKIESRKKEAKNNHPIEVQNKEIGSNKKKSKKGDEKDEHKKHKSSKKREENKNSEFQNENEKNKKRKKSRIDVKQTNFESPEENSRQNRHDKQKGRKKQESDNHILGLFDKFKDKYSKKDQKSVHIDSYERTSVSEDDEDLTNRKPRESSTKSKMLPSTKKKHKKSHH